MQRFRGGLVSKAHRRVYHIILGLRVITKKKKSKRAAPPEHPRKKKWLYPVESSMFRFFLLFAD
jgi:hypothetical protein